MRTRHAPRRFFTGAEQAGAAAVLGLLTGQDDDLRIPVLEMVDAWLAAGETVGWRCADMPARTPDGRPTAELCARFYRWPTACDSRIAGVAAHRMPSYARDRVPDVVLASKVSLSVPVISPAFPPGRLAFRAR